MAFNRYSLDLEASSSQFAYVADNSAVSITTDFTIEGWLKLEQLPSTAGTNFSIVTKYESTNNNRSFQFLVDTSNQLRVQYTSNGLTGSAPNTTLYTTETLTAGKWYHVAVAIDISAADADFYINGTLATTNTLYSNATTVYDGSSALVIGAREATLGSSYDSYFDGLISNIRLFSDIRTQQEIQDNMHSILTGTSNNLVGSWFNDANDYNDDAGTNNLTASGSPVFSTNVPWTGANTTDWSAPFEIQSDNTKVSGSSNHTDIPLLIADGNLSSAVYAGLNNSDYSLSLSSGSSQYANNSSTTILADEITNATLEGWVKLSSLPTSGNYMPLITIVTSASGNSGYLGAIRLHNNSGSMEVRTYFGGSGGTFSTNAYNIVTDKWIHIACVKEGSTISTYINGALQANTGTSGASQDWSTGSTGVNIGTNRTQSIFLDGKTSNVRIWSDVRTALEIQQNMYQTLSGTSDNLVASWYTTDNDHNDNASSFDLTASGSPTIVTDCPPVGDLRITTDSAGTTEVPFEQVAIDKISNTCEIWAKVPTLSYNANTSLFIWYGNSSAVAYDANAPFGSQAVWSDYNIKLPLQSNSNDSSDGNINGTDTDITYGTGKIGNGASSTGGSGDGISLGNVLPTTTGNATWSFWLKGNSAGNNKVIFCKGLYNNDGFYFQHTTGGLLQFISCQSGVNQIISASTAISDATWYKIDVVKDSTTIHIYLNGSEVSYSSGQTITNPATSSRNFYLFRYDAVSAEFPGSIDDFKVGNAVTSPDWIATEYNNQNSPSTFWIPGRRIFVIG